jgi:hypothetical protein
VGEQFETDWTIHSLPGRICCNDDDLALK